MRLPSIPGLGAKRDKIAQLVPDSPHEAGHAASRALSLADSCRVRPAVAPENDTIEGFLDSVDGDVVMGWAFDSAAPHRRLLIQVSAGHEVTSALADIYRKDLEDAEKGDGRHGFAATLNLGAAGADYVQVRVLPSGRELTGSPLKTDIVSLVANSVGRVPVELLRAEVHLASLALRRRHTW